MSLFFWYPLFMSFVLRLAVLPFFFVADRFPVALRVFVAAVVVVRVVSVLADLFWGVP